MAKTLAAFLSLCAGFVVTCSVLGQGEPTASTSPPPAAPGAVPATSPAAESGAGYVTIHNDSYWLDQNGVPILTRSGCLCQFNNVFYWYGGNPRGFPPVVS